MTYMLIFLLKKMSSLPNFVFSKNTCELDIVLPRTVPSEANKLVKLTMLWTTGPWLPSSLFAYGQSQFPLTDF